jgi:molybdenum cofactor cytidylyltransferase
MIHLSFGVALLAAGRSRRMGRPKLLLPWGRQTVLAHLLNQWRRVGAQQVGIVTAADLPNLLSELDQLGVPSSSLILNPQPDLGMFSSIQCAAQWPGWANDLSHIIVSLGDQPHLRDDTLAALVDHAAAHPDHICQPSLNGKRRHPVVIPMPLFRELSGTPAATLKEFLNAHADRCLSFESSDAGLDRDLDTPEDYEALRPG